MRVSGIRVDAVHVGMKGTKKEFEHNAHQE